MLNVFTLLKAIPSLFRRILDDAYYKYLSEQRYSNTKFQNYCHENIIMISQYNHIIHLN